MFRNGFVANSSSASFVCDICGNEHSGWDADPGDAFMMECENNHIICADHFTKEEWNGILIKYASAKGLVVDEDILDRTWNNTNDFFEYCGYDYLPADDCPMCRGDFVCDNDVIRYLKNNDKFMTIVEEARTQIKEMGYKAFYNAKD